MSTKLRKVLFVILALPVLAILIWGVMGLPRFGVYLGPYGIIVQKTTVPERHVTDVVTSVMFDQRGLDTLGEEFILFAAVVSVTLLLREYRSGGEEAETNNHNRITAHKTSAVTLLAILSSPIVFLFGFYITLQAHISVGGGFQGGIIAASAWLLLYLGDQREAFRRLASKHKSEKFEAIGAGAYALIGFSALIVGAAFLTNILPLGTAKELLSGGTIPVINLAVGVEVTAAFILLAVEFLKEAEKGESR